MKYIKSDIKVNWIRFCILKNLFQAGNFKDAASTLDFNRFIRKEVLRKGSKYCLDIICVWLCYLDFKLNIKVEIMKSCSEPEWHYYQSMNYPVPNDSELFRESNAAAYLGNNTTLISLFFSAHFIVLPLGLVSYDEFFKKLVF